jgi:hypothetical protein
VEKRFRERAASLQRHPATRDPKHRLLVVCEGKLTEPSYLRQLQHHVRNRLVHVEIVGPAGVPMTVVQRAIELREAADLDAKARKDADLRFDEVWGVFDIDEHPALDEAARLAADHGIELAVSSPCFELWALLHFQEQREQLHRDDAHRALRTYLPRYDKELDFRRLVAGYEDAVLRASELEKLAAAETRRWRNPSSGVFRLTERIRQAGQR